MYNRHYGFRENPFNQTPDSSFFYPSPKHKAALDALVYAIRERKGFVVVTGEVGSGKTTVARTLLRQIGSRAKTAVITNTHLTPKAILTLILEDLGAAYEHGSKTELLIQLNEYLLSQARQGEDVVLLIDEAQNLSRECLEEIRMLSNLETEKEKLIQIILIGQPELKKKLEMVSLQQLRQRIAVSYHLQALSEVETREYILHRLNLARANGRDMNAIFDPLSFEVIYHYSQGLPRLVNKICDHALLTGFVENTAAITPCIVADAIEELEMKDGRRDRTDEQVYQSA